MSTDSHQIRAARTAIAEALIPVAAADSSDSLADFAAGKADIAIDKLSLDSVARMELLVALELECNVVMPPEQLASFETLGALATHVAAADMQDLPVRLDDRPGTPGRINDNAPAVVALVRRVLRASRAVAHVRQLCTNLEHRLSPADVFELQQWHASGRLLPPNCDARFADCLVGWLNAMSGLLSAGGKAKAEPFQPRRLAPAVWHYVGSGNTADKVLIICFTPKGSRRMMIPQASLLQCFDATKHDVLILADPWGTCFRDGVPLIGKDVWVVIDWVAEKIAPMGYGNIRTVGCSAGSYPAILSAYRLRAELGLSVAGRLPTWGHLATIIGIVFNVWRATGLGYQPRLIMAFSARTNRDRRYARRIGRLTSAGSYAADVEGNGIGHRGHMVLNALQDIGALQRFVNDTLLADPTSDGLPQARETVSRSYGNVTTPFISA